MPIAHAVPDALNITGHGDYLPALRAAITSATKPTELDDALDRLVNALMEGTSDPDGFDNLQASRDDIINLGSFMDKDWPYGDYSTRRGLVQQMWLQAQKRAKTGDDKASRYVRAALLLSAYDEYGFGELSLVVFYTKWDSLVKVAALSPPESSKLKDILASLKQHYDARSAGDTAVIRVEAELTTHQGIIDKELAETELKALQNQRALINNVPGANLGQNHILIYITWQLRNLVQKRGDQQAKASVDDFLRTWLKDSTSKTISRWLTQSLVNIGKPFDEPRIINIK